MSCNVKSYPLSWTTVYAISTSAIFLPATAWMPTGNVAAIRSTFELAGRTGELEVAFGYQLADEPDSPDNGTEVGTYQATNGVKLPSGFTDTASATGAKQLVRFGWFIKLTTGSTPAFGRVAGTVEVVGR